MKEYCFTTAAFWLICSKSHIKSLKLLLWQQQKHKSSVLVYVWELMQWYRKLIPRWLQQLLLLETQLLQASYTEGQHPSWEWKRINKTSSPPLPQSSTTFVCIRQALFQKSGASRKAEAALGESPACPCCAAALLTHSWRGAPAQCPAHCQSLCMPPVQGEKVCLGLS